MNNDHKDWRVASCMLGFPAQMPDGTIAQDASWREWAAVFQDVHDEGFTDVEINDGWIKPALLAPYRRQELSEALASAGMAMPALHVQRASVIDPECGEQNLRYAHASIDVARELGAAVLSTGLHRPLTPAQRRSLWFWTVQGELDPQIADTWDLAVGRIRELGRHAAEMGLRLALELYEDTYLGTADGAVRFVEDVALDNVGLNPDVGNLIRLHRPVEDWRELYAKTLPYANYWHLKNYTRDEAGDGSWYSATPATLATGIINYREVIEMAVELGYRGVFTCEHYGGDSLTVCGENATYVRRMIARALNRVGSATLGMR